MVDADIHVVTNPLINITLQGRMDSYPKRRGYTRVPELHNAGLNVTMAQDCLMDPWYSGDKADMMEVVSMGYHVAHMTTPQQIESCFDMATINPAKTFHLEGYGVEVDCNADLVILNATNVVEAVRLKAERLFVIRRVNVIASTTPANTVVNINGAPCAVNYKRK